nr:hypothetical protein CJLB15_00105 [Campylobacter phage CJLB-15]
MFQYFQPAQICSVKQIVMTPNAGLTPVHLLGHQTMVV